MLAMAFGISYLLGAAAGALIGPIHYIATTGGTTMMIKGVAAAVLGGFGSLPGALVGGLAIGLLEALAAGFVSSAFKDVIVFAVFIGVLFFRPAGLLGARSAGRVRAVTQPARRVRPPLARPDRAARADRRRPGARGSRVDRLRGLPPVQRERGDGLPPARHRLQHPPRHVRPARDVPRRILRNRRLRLGPARLATAGVPYPVALGLALLLPTACAWVMARAAVRFVGPYLAMITFAFHSMALTIFINWTAGDERVGRAVANPSDPAWGPSS